MNFTYLECGQNWTGPVLGLDAPLSIDRNSNEGPIVGYIACAIASLMFGSNFVPFKFVKTGDGVFTQWVMCASIFCFGLIVQLVRQQPIFFSINLVGGAIWTIGNMCVVPVINLIGLSIGLLIWNSTNVLVGWATGRFGLFVCPQLPSNEIFNYLGVFLCFGAGFVYIFVKTDTVMRLPRCLRRFQDEESDVSTPANQPLPPQNAPLSPPRSEINSTILDASASNLLRTPAPEKGVFLGNVPPFGRRVIGIALAAASGCCYGVQFLPSGYVQDHVIVSGHGVSDTGARASQNGLDYVFAQYCGIFLASTVFFAIYVVFNRGKSFINVDVILPAIMSAFLWSIGTCCFFIANSTLSSSIVFPIIATVPGVVGALWGMLIFREIYGLKNFGVLALAFSMTFSGAILTALSKN